MARVQERSMTRPRPQAQDEQESQWWSEHGSILGIDLDGPAQPPRHGRLSEDAADQMISDHNQDTKPTMTEGGRAGRDGHGLQPRSGTESVKSPTPAAMVRSNGWEIAARLKKAHRLADKLHAAGITATESLEIKPEQWVQLAKAVRVNPPSPETQDVVMKILAGKEKW